MTPLPTDPMPAPAALAYPEAEAGLVSCALQGGAPTFLRAQDLGIRPGAFDGQAHRAVWQACARLVERGATCADPVLVVAELRATNALEAAGHEAGVQALMEFAPGSLCIEHYAELVYRAWVRRVMVRTAKKLEECATSLPEWDDFKAKSSEALAVVSRMQSAARGTSQAGQVEIVRRRVEDEIAGRRDQSREIPLGIETFDRRLGPFDPYFADYYAILAGGNSDGKSALARQCIAHNLRAGKRAAMFCLETTVQDTYRQMAGHLAGVNLRELEHERDDRKRAMIEQLDVVQKWAGQRLWVWDDVHNIEDLIGKVRWLIAENGMPDLVVIDYAQLLRTARRMPSREQEVAHVSMLIRRFASELQTQFVVLAQIARDVLREGRRPGKHDLRESQALVNDCDRLVLMHYPKETCRGEENALSNVERELHLLQEKSRNGKLGTVPAWFRKHLLRFEALNSNDEAALRERAENSNMAGEPPSRRKWDHKS